MLIIALRNSSTAGAGRMSELKTVQLFLFEHRAAYLALLEHVRRTCEKIRGRLGSERVADIYSRGRKQSGEELKDAAAILDKLPANKKSDRSAMRALGDVIGLTVVVHYSDDVDLTLGQIALELQKEGLEVYAPKLHKEGYFATHMIVRGPTGETDDLRCEVQCKTVLHNAWSEKMHDLSYKPRGRIDPKIDTLMRSIGRAIQSIEAQTRVVRDMVAARQSLERKAFFDSCEANLRHQLRLHAQQAATPEISERITQLWERIENAPPDVGAISDVEHIGREMLREIEGLGGDGLKHHSVLLAASLARKNPKAYARFFERQVDMLFDQMESAELNEAIHPRVVALVPIIFYSFGDFVRAIAFLDRILDTPQLSLAIEQDPTLRVFLEFNKVNILVESELLSPRNDPTRREAIYEEAQRILHDERVRRVEYLRSSAEDLDGLVRIVFGATSEEVKNGIDLCQRSAATAPEPERDSADAYLNWRLQAGWRRYFELAEAELHPTPARPTAEFTSPAEES